MINTAKTAAISTDGIVPVRKGMNLPIPDPGTGVSFGKGNGSEMQEYVDENEFVKAVRTAGGVASKLTFLTVNDLPDRLVLLFPAKTAFVYLKAPGKMLRQLQRQRHYQLMKLGFPVHCIDRLTQIKPAISSILTWTPPNRSRKASTQRYRV